MINKFSRLTALMACSLAVLFFTSFQLFADVGDRFTVNGLEYYVITEEGAIGTVSVYRKNDSGLCNFIIPDSIENNGIKYKVTSIPSRAFYYRGIYPSLTSITIPNSVTSIGDRAFAGCSNLTNIVIPDSVTTIGVGVFAGCSNLTSVIIGKGVTSIGVATFNTCDSLTDVYYRGDVNSVDRSLYLTSYYNNKDKFKIYYPKGNPSWDDIVENGKLWNYNVVPYPAEDDLVYKVLTREDTEITLAVTSYMGTFTNLVIPSSFEGGGLTCYVTEIGDRAFYKSKGLQHVEIPPTIKSIGGEAFLGCVNLKEINIPNSVTSIGFGAFANCRELESAVFEGNTKLDNSVFYDCQLLSKVVFHDVFEEIGTYTFARCDQLWSIHIPDTVTCIGDSAFYRCRGLTEIIIPESVTEIGDSVFVSCTNLTSAIIPDSVASIGSFVFNECDQLPSVLFSTGEKILVRYSPSNADSSYNIPDTVTYIAGSAFFRCADLKSIKIPDTVTGIGDNAFCGCRGLTQIEIPNSVISIGNCSFDTCDSLKSIIIPDSVTSIGDNVFYNCYSLESVDIGKYVQSIEYTMFSSCTNLLNITINPDNPVYSSLDGVLFNKDRSHLIVCPAGRKGAYILPDNVNTIEDHAFSGCRELTSITIPGSVVFIGDDAFASCVSLTSVYYQGDVPTVIFDYYPHYYAHASCIYYDTPNSLISYYPLENASWNAVISSDEWQERKAVGMTAESFWSGDLQYLVLSKEESTGVVSVQGASVQKEIMIPDFVENDGITYRVTRIGAYAFNGNFDLKSITIPDSVISIGDYAFAECKSLTDITIPDSIISIGDNAFSGCRSLTNLSIPDSVIFIGNAAFYECKGLTSITIPSNLTFISDSAFQNCSALVSITIPNSVISIGDYSFKGCYSLSCIIIPDSVTAIGWYAFSGCYRLKHVYFEGNAPSVGREAFGSFGYSVIPYYLSGSEGWENWWVNWRPKVECNGWMTQDGIIYEYKSNDAVIVSGYAGEQSSVVIPATILMDSVSYSVVSIGSGAFSEHINLTGITIPDSVTSIDGDAFYRCSGLTSITIPDSVTSIGNSVFAYCYSLTNIVVGNGVKSIGDTVFRECMSLTNITIPNSVTSIGYRVFYGCSSLTQITADSSNQNYSSIDGVLFNKDQTVLIQYPAGRDDKSYTIPEGVTSIGIHAFEGCSSLTNIVIPDSVTSISGGAFYRCNSLTSIKIPDSVISIDNGAFSFCDSLTSVTIGNVVTSIGDSAFYNCRSLTNVYFKGNAPTLNQDVFYNTPATIYYRVGTEGWTNPWGGRPTALWVEAPEITEQPQSQSTVEGNSVTFTVSTTGTAPLSYQWQKDGVDIIGATDASYTISHVMPTDAGGYRVVVSNSAGSVTSGAATLTVRYSGTATISMNSVNPVIYGDSCGPLAGQKVNSDIWGSLLYNGQEIARQVFTSAAAGKPTGKLKGGIIETDLLPAGTEVTLQLAAFDQGYLDHPDTGHYYYGISKPFTYKTGDSKKIQPDSNLLFDSFTVEWVETPVDELVIRFELEGDMLLLKWTAGTDAVLQVSESIADSWVDITEGIQTEDGSCIYKASITAKQAFYRLKMP